VEKLQGEEEILAHKKGSGENDNHVAQYEMAEKHTAVLNEKQRAHNLKMDGLRNEIMRLMDEVNNMKRANSEHMRQIVDDASRGEKAHSEKFKGDKETVENDERESKAKYQQQKSMCKERRDDLIQLDRSIMEKNKVLMNQKTKA
jgi:hypothetical protein